ncbi:extracellular matrix-binding ebh [Babesia caballi]|uniref:Extracellular matrix-binding ebh n=1 Tax=Babesia caballi TaxID=5871 RepID=A0AAV4LN85_BABCB|nr:extracellular matrix-binding ebh [Babesia caballi]
MPLIRPLSYSLNDCASNLKEAIGWILRVTGKLAKAITELPDFKQAIEAAVEKLQKSGGGVNNVSQALQKLQVEGTLKNIIEQLTHGLRAFIGYSGGKGIALVIDPLQQLRKGVLGFLSALLGNLRSHIKDDTGAHNAVNGAIRDNGTTFESALEKLNEIKETNRISDVVRVLKNVSDFQNKQLVNELANGFQLYLDAVLGAVKTSTSQASGQVESLCQKLSSLLVEVGKQNAIKTHIAQVKEANRTLESKRGRERFAKALIPAVTMGTESFLKQIEKDGYESSYPSTSNWTGDTTNKKMAQIFLGCLPLYYYWLTYLYWKCRENGGEWEGQRLNSGPLNAFMVGHGYVTDHLNKHPGKNIAPLLERFDKLKDSMQTASGTPPTTIQPSHPDLLNELNNKLNEALASTGNPPSPTLNGHSLSALFYLGRGYFTGKHIMQSGSPSIKCRPPISIREMLYWLSGLQFSPHYSSIEKQIDHIVPEAGGIPVADSSIASTANSTGGDTLTQSQMKGFLLSSCLSAPGVLGAIQGNTADSKDEAGKPWLYSLFCNSMNLQYPSGSTLFNTLANYAYALQFQLHFLYRQCLSTYSYTCGWKQCAFGKNVNEDIHGSIVVSYICATKCKKGGNHSHSTRPDQCEHTGCGSNGKGSPLQAFLTDNLKGFCRQQPGTSNHLSTCAGTMCHLPMGFAGKLRTDAGGGLNIAYALNPFCSSPSTPLRQLSEKLGCLTKRTPRTLGDLFGFIWHLNGQLLKSRPRMAELAKMLVESIKTHRTPNNVPNFILHILDEIGKNVSSISGPYETTGLSRSLEAMAPTIPFLYHLFMAEEPNTLPGAIFDLTQHCHETVNETGVVRGQSNQPLTVIKHKNSECSEPTDLWSIFQGLDTKPSGNNTDTQAECRSSQCGGYLSPLTHTYGAAYSPKFASTYLSWVVYLVEVFNEQLDELLVEFNNINCEDCGPHCSCTKGQHGTTNCSCHSVVSCAGVLPVLYGHGFNFTNAYTLKGGTNGTDSRKRNCQNFQNALSNILKAEAPLHTLLTVIDDFLYMFRFYFFYNLSSFWIMYVCIVIYIYFLRADLLHLKSHVRLPSSHGVPSISLLPTGKPTVLTKFTKLTYFAP